MIDLIRNTTTPLAKIDSTTSNIMSLIQILKSQQTNINFREINYLRLQLAKAALKNSFILNLNDTYHSFDINNTQTIQDRFYFHQKIIHFLTIKSGINILQIEGFNYPTNCSDLFNTEVDSLQTSIQNAPQESIKQSIIKHLYADLYYRELNRWNQGTNYEKKTYSSCEIVSLNEAQVVTRTDKRSGLRFIMESHFPMIDEKNLHKPSYINYLEKISNPISLKINSSTSLEHISEIINQLDPFHFPGRLTIIPCFGIDKISSLLPRFIEVVRKTHPDILWSCDPQSGNYETISGSKTAKLSNVLKEVEQSFLIHKFMGSKLKGLHLQTTNQNVNEISSYNFKKNSSDIAVELQHEYPRLNFEQTIHLAQHVAKHLQV